MKELAEEMNKDLEKGGEEEPAAPAKPVAAAQKQAHAAPATAPAPAANATKPAANALAKTAPVAKQPVPIAVALKQTLSKEEAEDIKAKLEAAGAEVEVK